MHQYKWCVLDMDGTLLDSHDTISKENETALNKLQKNGVEVIIASGRVDLMLKRYIRQLNLKGHIISCNGGLIRNIETGEIVYSKAMDRNTVKQIISFCLKEQIHLLVYTSDVVYTNKDNPKAVKYERINQSLDADLRFPVEYIVDPSLQNTSDKDILKILLICKNQNQVEQLQKRFVMNKDISVVSSADGLLDIMASNTSKGRALKILSEKEKVDPKQIIAFGDNYNDIEMLQFAGMSVAVENSVPQVKDAARYVTKSNDESGVAYAINHLLK